MNKNYELMLIFKTDLSEELFSQAVGKVKELFTKYAKGEITKVNDWGKRDLAYPILKQTEGYYQVWDVSAPPDGLVEFNTRLKREDSVLRSLLTLI